MKIPSKTVGAAALAAGAATAVLYLAGSPAGAGPCILISLFFLALAFMGHPVLKNFAFTAWVFVFVAAALLYPSAFGAWFGLDLRFSIVPLIQVIMFGMGTTLSVKDFARILNRPWPVLFGFVAQYSVMPLVGFSIAMAFGFEPEIAAGIILVGSCPGGVASNLMTFLAGGDVALSVTMTSCSTLLSPVMTPFWMKTLAGKLVPVNFLEMMFSIIDMIIVPILAGLLANRLLYHPPRLFKKAAALPAAAFACSSIASLFLSIDRTLLGPFGAVKNGLVIGLFLIALVVAIKWVIEILLRRTGNWMDRVLPLLSMLGICLIIGIITARSSEKLLSVGLALLGAVILHNTIGYMLGFWISRAMGFDRKVSITVAIEVGLQNGGMASGLAMGVLKSADAAIAPAIFGPWMNVSGSVLANWYKRRLLKIRKEELRGPSKTV